MDNTNIKSARLTMRLVTDDGMTSTSEFRVSADQWAAIDAAAVGTTTPREWKVAAFLCKIKDGLMLDHAVEAEALLDLLEKPLGIDGPPRNVKTEETQRYTVQLDFDTGKGWFEHLMYGDEKGGGLWVAPLATVNGEGICQACGRVFDDIKDCPCPSDDCPSNNEDKKFELTDYDGVSCLPREVIGKLRDWGVVVSPEFE